MNTRATTTESAEVTALGAAVRNGDETAFTAVAGRHRRELLVHCYRMLGSLQDAEDAVQETFLRAWRYRESVREGLSLRPWLYRIATNSCLDAIARDPRRTELAPEAPEAGQPAEVPWLQPFPDALLEPVAPRESEPDAVAMAREAIELAFLTVLQRLGPQQRAALILRDVLGWSAKETADLLELSVAAANSALQRARAIVRAQVPPRRLEQPGGVGASGPKKEAERELLRKYVQAAEENDLSLLVSLIREDAIFRMPPEPSVGIVCGRDPMVRLFVEGGFGTEQMGQLRCVPTRANNQPAMAAYVRHPGDPAWSALALDVLQIEDGLISEIVTFAPDVFPAFGLPLTLEDSEGEVHG